MANKAKFMFPGAFIYFPVYINLFKLIKLYPEKFNSFCEIKALYGCPSGLKWNSGRAIPNPEILFPWQIIADYSYEYNIPIFLTLTNSEIDISDSFGNKVLNSFYSENNGIILKDDNFENYIRHNYPQYKIASSVTKVIREDNKVKEELCKDYDTVILDTIYNKNFDFLNSISISDRSKIELLANMYCIPNCPYTKEHYKYIDNINSKTKYNGSLTEIPKCKRAFGFYQAMKLSHFISIDDIKNYYLPNDITIFKLEGRSNSVLDVIETIAYYFVKPEYQMEIRFELSNFKKLEINCNYLNRYANDIEINDIIRKSGEYKITV